MGMFNFVLDSIKGELFDFKVKRRVLVASTVVYDPFSEVKDSLFLIHLLSSLQHCSLPCMRILRNGIRLLTKLNNKIGGMLWSGSNIIFSTSIPPFLLTFQ